MARPASVPSPCDCAPALSVVCVHLGSLMSPDVRVPVCPLCNSPVPVKKGEIPDVVVGAHMDGECQRPPGQETAKVFTFRCSREGCRRREMLRVACEECRGSFCLQHRHPLDHGCARRGPPASSAG
ncbi:ZFAND2A [Cervus elaphus hippelaphus]|uniref:ZFAND2A n=1 Tax=Cervus elaphus hippelaphus TaxID=46360 RepID=A0A212CZH4_CEREH|nr:ZFAND2A [Cervus elaphus hippelaphus]